MKKSICGISLKEITGALLVGVLFIVGAYLAKEFAAVLAESIDTGVVGMITYVLAAVFATVVAPVSALPVLPLAVSLWGPNVAALLSAAGWFSGAMLAFWIARSLGKRYVSRVINIRRIEQYQNMLGEGHLFLTIVFLRLALPVDILSYAIGLFTTIGWRLYAIATVIGIVPFAFIFSYTARTDVWVQILVLAGTGLLLLLGYLKVRKNISAIKGTTHDENTNEQI